MNASQIAKRAVAISFISVQNLVESTQFSIQDDIEFPIPKDISIELWNQQIKVMLLELAPALTETMTKTIETLLQDLLNEEFKQRAQIDLNIENSTDQPGIININDLSRTARSL